MRAAYSLSLIGSNTFNHITLSCEIVVVISKNHMYLFFAVYL